MSGPVDLLRPVPNATVLVVVDIQTRLAAAVDPGQYVRLGKAVRTLVELARLSAWPIVATEQYPQGLGATVPEIAQELAAAGAKSALEKLTFSACAAEGFSERVGPSARAAVVVGMEAHVCVIETAFDLLRRGLHVFVPWDGVASRREEDRTTALALLRAAGAVVTSSETIAFQTLGRAGTPEFKAISARVR